MSSPEQRLFEADVQAAPYRIGAAKGQWGLAGAEALPENAAWPKVYLWMAAAPRTNAPDRFYVALDLTGYRTAPPTGAFWDPVKRKALALDKWPKGRAGSRFAMVFRTSGFTGAGSAFYHPYDRVALIGHARWSTEQPHLVWSDSHTIVDYLEEFQTLLTSGDYLGI
ncbi:MAG TPA: hypothetical protein VMU69_07660 [Bradyrhizobium sp.]|nr:hypothetical protein [Bradyrhizobium sp.]